MTKFILHGGYAREDNASNRGFFEELSKDVPEGGTILLCYFASENSIEERFKEISRTITEEAHGKTLHIVLATEEGFLDELRSADALYINGGDTKKLLETLKKYPAFKTMLEGKTVAGSSAGAYVLSTFFYSGTRRGVFEGLGLLPLRVVCHFQSPKETRTTEDSLAALEEASRTLELVVLKDYEWKVFRS